MSATAQVVEQRMTPVTSTQQVVARAMTGQYLYDNFVKSSQEQITRMMVIESWAKNPNVDETIMRESFKTMVERAKADDVALGVIEEGKRGPKEQGALNVRTIVQNAIGALRKAPQELSVLGYKEGTTGYIEMGRISAAALKAKGIRWNGKALPSEESKQQAKTAEQLAARMAAEAQWRMANPKNEGESDFEYFQRFTQNVDGAIAKLQAEENARKVSDRASKVIKSLGDDVEFIESVAKEILNRVAAIREAIAKGEVAPSSDESTEEESEATE